MVNTISAGFASRLDAAHLAALQDKPGPPLDLSDIPEARRMAAERDALMPVVPPPPDSPLASNQHQSHGRP